MGLGLGKNGLGLLGWGGWGGEDNTVDAATFRPNHARAADRTLVLVPVAVARARAKRGTGGEAPNTRTTEAGERPSEHLWPASLLDAD